MNTNLLFGLRFLAKPQDAITLDEAVKDPYVPEFLNLKDAYSENQLEEALIQRLEDFLLELGGDFTFVRRQRPCAGSLRAGRVAQQDHGSKLQNRAARCRGVAARAGENPADAGATWCGAQVGESGVFRTNQPLALASIPHITTKYIASF